MDFTWVDGFAAIVALVVGAWLTRVDWWNTKFVPLGKLIVIALIKIATALGIGPAAAHAATMGAIVAAVWWQTLIVEIAKVLLTTLATVGAHSAPKNIKEGLAGQK